LFLSIFKEKRKDMLKYYNVLWDNVKTIKDIKLLLSIMATKVVINHDDTVDVEIYENMKKLLEESTEEITS
jgi:hypothetical protein